MKLNRENWFLVLPTIVIGIVASYTLYQMHAAGDVRRAIEIVAGYEAEGMPPLADFLATGGPTAWDSSVVSRFYGTMDVICEVGVTAPKKYVWENGVAAAGDTRPATMTATRTMNTTRNVLVRFMADFRELSPGGRQGRDFVGRVECARQDVTTETERSGDARPHRAVPSVLAQ